MQFTIIGGGNQEHVVEAFESVTPGLLITMDIKDANYLNHRTDSEPNIRPKWHVTHVGTTQKITGSPVFKSHAKLIAGALGGLPIDWTVTSREEVFKMSREVVEPFKTWLIRGLRD